MCAAVVVARHRPGYANETCAVARPPLVQFFIPAPAAIGVNVTQLASRAPTSRLSYRFIYRILNDGPVYGCRIKASNEMADVLMTRLHDLAASAEAKGDRALSVGCSVAMAAIADAR